MQLHSHTGRSRRAILALSGALAFASIAFSSRAADDTPVVPPFKQWKDVRPAELKKFDAAPPERVELPNGMIVFLLEDHELPLIQLSMTLRAGQIHEPADSVGLADATASVMRTGGSQKYPGDKLDEMLENMAASLSIGFSTDQGSVSLEVLKEDFDKGLDILNDVLRHPAFPEDKIELYLSHARTGIGRRNDNTNAVASREFRKALYGEKSPFARMSEYTTLEHINRNAIQQFHDTYFHPNLFMLGVVGDFKKDEMMGKLKAAFGDWQAVKVTIPTVEPIPTTREKRILFVDRPKLGQTTVMLGHVLDMRKDHKDYPAIQMLNEILSGGMSARLFTEVRTKKGLAYAVHGQAALNYDRPGIFYCSVITRNEQSLEAVDAVRQEIVRIKDQGVTEGELAEARERIINSFVFNFDTPDKILNRQMNYEFYHYPPDFANKLLEAIKLVTVADVNRVAKQYLDPDNAVLLAIGCSKPDVSKCLMSLSGCKPIDITIPPPTKK